MNAENQVPAVRLSLFASGFRCFFLGAALLAASSIALWGVMFVSGRVSGLHYFPPLTWHMHEMVFGYTGAVIAGFLLTAVSNWTGRPTLRGAALVILFVIWAAAHCLPYIAVVPGWVIALLNCLFFIYLAVAIGIPIVASRNFRNLFVIGIVTLLAICNAMVHGELLGFTSQGSGVAIIMALYLELLLITIIAGRVFPMFSARGVAQPYQPRSYRWLEFAALLAFAVFAAACIVQVAAPLLLLITVIAVALHVVRVGFWFNRQIFSVPLVWVLHVGYYLLIVGMLLTGLSGYYPETRVAGMHAMLIGGLGMITLGMMARVSLGHSGRNIHKPPVIISWLFLLLAIAALSRTFIPLLAAQHTLIAIQISAVTWSLAFALFFLRYLPFLLFPRVDGAAG